MGQSRCLSILVENHVDLVRSQNPCNGSPSNKDWSGALVPQIMALARKETVQFAMNGSLKDQEKGNT